MQSPAPILIKWEIQTVWRSRQRLFFLIIDLDTPCGSYNEKEKCELSQNNFFPKTYSFSRGKYFMSVSPLAAWYGICFGLVFCLIHSHILQSFPEVSSVLSCWIPILKQGLPFCYLCSDICFSCCPQSHSLLQLPYFINNRCSLPLVHLKWLLSRCSIRIGHLGNKQM